MRHLLCLAAMLGLGAQGAAALDWTLRTEENEAFRTASLSQDNGNITFYCGTVLTGDTGFWEELDFTKTGYLHLLVSESLMGPYGLDVPDPQTVRMFTFGQDVTAPPFYFDVMGGLGWVAEVPYDHPMVDAAAGGAEVVIGPDRGEPFSIYGTGLPDGMSEMLKFCKADPASPSPDTGATGSDPELVARAEAGFESVCHGSYDLGPDAITEQDLTGDGVPDLLVDFGAMTCTGGLFAGKTGVACAGEMCRHDILTDTVSDPLILYATGVRLSDDDPTVILVGLDADACRSMNQDAGCAVRMQWTGETFGTVGLQ